MKKLRVGIISTGDELVPPEQQPGPGQIRDVNGPMLQALFAAAGAETDYYGILKDEEKQLKAAATPYENTLKTERKYANHQ